MADPNNACFADECPFCGEGEDLYMGETTEDREGVPTFIVCGACGAKGPWVYIPVGGYPKLAYDAWNRRKEEGRG